MSIYDKTDRWDDENAGKPLPPTRQQLEARITELEAERDHLKALVRDQSKDLADDAARITELEAERAKLAEVLRESSGLIGARVRGYEARIAELETALVALSDKARPTP